MNNLVDLLARHLVDTQAGVFLLDIACKSLLLLALAAGFALLLAKASSAARHRVWFLALLALLILPFVSWGFPRGERHLWSLSTTRTSVHEIVLAFELGSISDSALPTLSSVEKGTPVGEAHPPAPFEPLVPAQIEARVDAWWFGAVVGLWWTGALTLLTWMVAGRIALRKLRNSATPLQDPGWSEQVDELRAALGIGRHVDLLQARSQFMPATWGTFRPVILLPSDAGAWSKARRRAVLLHELAHVKRCDCLTQTLAGIVTALHWVNPLAWIAARRMSVERERACDDLVLNNGWKGSDYASHLLAIARASRPVRTAGAIAMARPSQLGPRIAAILDPSRPRKLKRSFTVMSGLAAFVLLLGLAAQQPQIRPALSSDPVILTPDLEARLRTLFDEKKRLAQTMVPPEQAALAPELWEYFDAGSVGDWTTVTRLWTRFEDRLQEQREAADPEIDEDALLQVYWLGGVRQPILETWLAYELFSTWRPHHVMAFGNAILGSIPRGSIYFGGTDAGRGIVSALSGSHTDADPFFTLTQNALADQLYLHHLRAMYDGRIELPDNAEHGKAMNDYLVDAYRRFQGNQLLPSEQVHLTPEGVLQISGQTSVMQINALLVRVIFDKNPKHEFYIEESFPLDWMYPHLVPHGPILRIERRPLIQLPDDALRQDHEYWQRLLRPRIGPWLDHSASLDEVVAFVQRVLRDQDFNTFVGDPTFVSDQPARQAFAKLRLAIAGVYAWRAQHTEPNADRSRITSAAHLAFRQAFALAPDLPEVIIRHATWLEAQGLRTDAVRVLEVGASFSEPIDPEIIQRLEGLQERAGR
jgi:beta-lactamase regulating signal transducer with metallopeptidase domain